MTFNFDADSIVEGVITALNAAEQDLSEDQVNSIINQINACMPGLVELSTYQTEETWKDIAISHGGWGEKYAKAIRSHFDGEVGTVDLDDSSIDPSSKKPNLMFAEMMEKGVKTWSIKAALMASDKAKVGKDGVKYITVPFPVATPRKKGQGQMQSYFGGREMSSEIHKLVKEGGRAPEGSTVTVTTMRGSKQVGIDGLSRYNTRQRHSQYGIFRRVSEKSNGWQYPNVSPTPVFDSVVEYVNKRMKEIIQEFTAQIIADNS